MAHTNNGVSRGGMSAFSAAVVGAAVGAVAVYLSSDKNRQTLQKKMSDIRHRGEDLLDKVKHTAEEVTSKGKTAVKRELKKAQQTLEGDQAIQTT